MKQCWDEGCDLNCDECELGFDPRTLEEICDEADQLIRKMLTEPNVKLDEYMKEIFGGACESKSDRCGRS